MTSQLDAIKAKQVALAPTTPASQKKRVFISHTAGSGTILPSGRRITFHGKPGGLGYYETNKQEEIDWLEDLAKSPTSQVSEVVNDTVVEKYVDPALQQAVEDARHNSELVLDPNVSAAVGNLGKHIAANS